jgi:hypothetical protein
VTIETLTNTEPRPAAPTKEPTVRLSVDLPDGLHVRFKVACIAAGLTMTAELLTLIERRTTELEGKQ